MALQAETDSNDEEVDAGGAPNWTQDLLGMSNSFYFMFLLLSLNPRLNLRLVEMVDMIDDESDEYVPCCIVSLRCARIYHLFAVCGVRCVCGACACVLWFYEWRTSLCVKYMTDRVP